jgi:hypothetical protein
MNGTDRSPHRVFRPPTLVKMSRAKRIQSHRASPRYYRVHRKMQRAYRKHLSAGTLRSHFSVSSAEVVHLQDELARAIADDDAANGTEGAAQGSAEAVSEASSEDIEPAVPSFAAPAVPRTRTTRIRFDPLVNAVKYRVAWAGATSRSWLCSDVYRAVLDGTARVERIESSGISEHDALEYEVRWADTPARFNSWIGADALQHLPGGAAQLQLYSAREAAHVAQPRAAKLGFAA